MKHNQKEQYTPTKFTWLLYNITHCLNYYHSCCDKLLQQLIRIFTNASCYSVRNGSALGGKRSPFIDAFKNQQDCLVENQNLIDTSIKSIDDFSPGNSFFSSLVIISSAISAFFASYSSLESPWCRKKQLIMWRVKNREMGDEIKDYY